MQACMKAMYCNTYKQPEWPVDLCRCRDLTYLVFRTHASKHPSDAKVPYKISCHAPVTLKGYINMKISQLTVLGSAIHDKSQNGLCNVYIWKWYAVVSSHFHSTWLSTTYQLLLRSCKITCTRWHLKYLRKNVISPLSSAWLERPSACHNKTYHQSS